MKNNKSFLLALIISASLCACSPNQNQNNSNGNQTISSEQSQHNVVSEDEIIKDTIEKTVTCDNTDVTQYTDASVTSTLTSIDIYRDKYVLHFTVSFESSDEEIQKLTLSTSSAGMLEWAGNEAVNIDPDEEDNDLSPLWDGVNGYGSDKTINSGESTEWEISFDRKQTDKTVTQIEVEINWAGWLSGEHRVTIN